MAIESGRVVLRPLPRTTDLEDFAASSNAAIRVVTEDDTVGYQTPRAPDFGVPFPRTFETDGWRVENRRVTVFPGNRWWIQYARPISEVQDTANRVKVFLAFGVFGGALLALLAGLATARRAMEPITELTAAAREIERSRDPSLKVPHPEADDEVAELARTLDDMLHALEASRAESAAQIVRQRQFVADASHELRTPLTSVLANLELLTEVLEGEPADAAKSALRSTHRMRRLVGDLLLLARADAERETPRSPTDLATIVVDAAAELGPLAADHVMTVDAPNGAVVEGARDELHRLALNLMQNALQHTPPGTHVRAIVRHDDDEVVLTVEDDGPGVPPSLRERVFDRFVRGEGDRGGTVGLGLSIVRAVARTHGGDVTLESPASGGARFIVRLPATPVREAATAAA
jgi:signal transduction histidine kinase